MAVFCFILGIVVFLVMSRPVVFWAVFVPLALIFVVALVKFFKDGGMGVKNFATAMSVLAIMAVILLIVTV